LRKDRRHGRHRLDRLGRPRSTAARFRPRELPTADAAEFVRAGIGAQQTSYAVEALVQAPASTVRDQVGRWATVEGAGDGQCLVRMTSDSLDRPTMALGALGAEFEVRSPPELITHLRDWCLRFSAATAG
jgi:predicted DNA-binding transcriptional regulator YafY